MKTTCTIYVEFPTTILSRLADKIGTELDHILHPDTISWGCSDIGLGSEEREYTYETEDLDQIHERAVKAKKILQNNLTENTPHKVTFSYVVTTEILKVG